MIWTKEKINLDILVQMDLAVVKFWSTALRNEEQERETTMLPTSQRDKIIDGDKTQG